MPINTELLVDLVEKELVEIELVEKELVDIELAVIDVLSYHEKTVTGDLKQEVPTQVSGMQFQTSSAYVTGTLKVFINGLKEKISQIREDSSTKFTLLDSIDLSLDYIEVEYLEEA